MKDPEFLADAAKTKLTVGPMRRRGASEADHHRQQSDAGNAGEGPHRLCNRATVVQPLQLLTVGGNRLTQFCHCLVPTCAGWRRFMRCRGNRVSGGAGQLMTRTIFRTFLAVVLALTLGVHAASAQGPCTSFPCPTPPHPIRSPAGIRTTRPLVCRRRHCRGRARRFHRMAPVPGPGAGPAAGAAAGRPAADPARQSAATGRRRGRPECGQEHAEGHHDRPAQGLQPAAARRAVRAQ